VPAETTGNLARTECWWSSAFLPRSLSRRCRQDRLCDWRQDYGGRSDRSGTCIRDTCRAPEKDRAGNSLQRRPVRSRLTQAGVVLPRALPLLTLGRHHPAVYATCVAKPRRLNAFRPPDLEAMGLAVCLAPIAIRTNADELPAGPAQVKPSNDADSVLDDERLGDRRVHADSCSALSGALVFGGLGLQPQAFSLGSNYIPCCIDGRSSTWERRRPSALIARFTRFPAAGDKLDAAEAAFRVGYESPSQFSREYRRMFGAPPRQDVAAVQLRTSRAASPASAGRAS
jgi:AraC-like DNA-binding protein